MKKLLLTIMILAPMFLMAQSDSDLFDFSSIYYQGTAKSAAMGNAMGAVGSDFSAIAINPAGLGLFRKSTFVFTPEFYAISTESSYKGDNGSDRAFKLPINNIGLTWTQEINSSSLKSVSFALGVNKLNQYAYQSYVNGNNPNTSLIDAYIEQLYQNDIFDDYALEDYSPNGIFPLWETYLLDFYDDYTIGSDVPQGGLNQQFGVSKRGSSREFSFAAGFNFNEKLFLGASVNIPYFDKTTTIEYKETNLYSGEYFRNWAQDVAIKNSGAGINAKVGAIIYPVKWLRLGAAFHTPSLYKVEESWGTDTRSSFNGAAYNYSSPTGTYTYTVTTPYRLNASAALIFGNFGMITADYEFIDYSKMRASSYDYNYSNFNKYIRNTYSTTSNIRLGTEWRWQTMAFRAGYAFYGSPFGMNKTDYRTNSYSCGFGFTYHVFTLDLAYVFSQRHNSYNLYEQYSEYPAYYEDQNGNWVADDTKVKETTNINQVVISLKFRLD